MNIYWKLAEQIVLHVVATAVLIFCFAIAIGLVQAHPSNTSCHKHGVVVHCK